MLTIFVWSAFFCVQFLRTVRSLNIDCTQRTQRTQNFKKYAFKPIFQRTVFYKVSKTVRKNCTQGVCVQFTL